jgi:hypothetical protein
MNNEIRNILLYLATLKKEIDKNEIEENNKKDIDFYYNQILERIKFLIEDDKKEHMRKIETLDYNRKLLIAIEKGEL